MITFSAVLQKFASKGEKTGWTYVELPVEVTESLKPGMRQAFRVKGKLDNFPIKSVSLIPMGEGAFIMAINATMRQAIRKEKDAIVHIALEVDDDPLPESADLLACLEDEPKALDFFNQLTRGHQNYFYNWIESAKTPQTKADRIAKSIKGLAMGMGYGEMIRYFKNQNSQS
ncbi:YdeI/OmpD-associated family protein [Cytophagaceae bacterium YF14B1]|uniref:YdeI/OmpD-associated family protein n=1 Tax=Xanthocytophaga flava TaxID=3048013 RepID=A0AAE3U973_9BACT|nr:YdeI/OmpD-associated family protein [Xanthocytophaga flavus]MDJ1481429.1 YdeI/OmpD-associated family protein [Xanthocytophaga flavus]